MFTPAQINSLERTAEKEKDSIFIVEGKRDKLVLHELGMEHVIAISGRQLEEVVEEAARVERKRKAEDVSVVILTDFDRDGNRKFIRLENLLHSSGIRVKNSVRNFFRDSLKVTEIEELKKAARLVSRSGSMKELNRMKFSKKEGYKKLRN